MTCIVGFTDKKNNVTWIGADSLGSNGYTQDVESNPKVFRNTTLKNVVMGSTSTFRHIDLLKYSKTLFPEIDKYKIPSGETKVNHEYMVTTFVPNIITLFENGIKDSGDKGGNFQQVLMENFMKFRMIILFLNLWLVTLLSVVVR